MASHGQDSRHNPVPGETTSSANASAPHRPTEALVNSQTADSLAATEDSAKTGKKRRNHRAGKKKRNRRQSFMAEQDNDPSRLNSNAAEGSTAPPARPPFYRLGQSGGRNFSETSLDSEELLDHRDHPVMRQRRESRIPSTPFGMSSAYRAPPPGREHSREQYHPRRRSNRPHLSSEDENDDDPDRTRTTDRTPLLASAFNRNNETSSPHRSGYGLFGNQHRNALGETRNRRTSIATSASSGRRRGLLNRQNSSHGGYGVHDVNNPPSVPNSPKLGAEVGFDDVMLGNSFTSKSPDGRKGDHLIDIDGDDEETNQKPRKDSMERRHTIAGIAEEDVCFPIEGMSAIGEEDFADQSQEATTQQGSRRRRFRHWPDLGVLEEWSRDEKEERSEGMRAKKISEPVLVGGRLRPQKHGWHREEEDAPYRFTYFNEELPSTIHSSTISELRQSDQGFRELFVPEPPELSDFSSDDEEDITSHQGTINDETSPNGQSRAGTRHSSIIGTIKGATPQNSGEATPSQQGNGPAGALKKPKRYGERPTFWLDVLSPTEMEMKIISKAFAIHPLTAEDIMMQEAREKVELFRNYYFVNYRTFEQDTNSEDFLQPVNMYVVVFPEGVISFHFSMSPHPANVRRRIRQLRDYIKVSADWVSYAIIDDITDVFAPLIQSIEEEVDDIDDAILKLHSGEEVNTANSSSEKVSKTLKDKFFKQSGSNASIMSDEKSDSGHAASGGDMLRRVGEGRKKVMLLYRLLGNKADVIKGFAKRCNERYDIAPRSDIGLYLGDIQDHILTMTSNLSHYETLLSRAHSNYLAQINIRMNERQEQTADVLGKLTVLGTIVLPMNIVTGMWGMNVLVPGQDVDNLVWFWCITAGLLIFGTSCFFIAKRVYGIV